MFEWCSIPVSYGLLTEAVGGIRGANAGYWIFVNSTCLDIPVVSGYF